MAKILKTISNLLAILKIYYWNTFVATLICLFKYRSKKPLQKQWAKMAISDLNVKIQELQGSKGMEPGKVMFVGNHRSQADFFLHNIILNYQANILSRYAVAVLIPNFLVAYNTLWFFNRGGHTDPQKFNRWLDSKFEDTPRPALLAYPEGHRMQGVFKVDKSKIKTGMLRYAYRRQMPTQIFMSFGNEQCFDQKRLHVSRGQTVWYKFAEAIDPRNFEDENEFVERVKERFCEFFEEVYEGYQKAKAAQGPRI